MLALWRDWSGDGSSLDRRIATSLGLFAGHPAAYYRDGATAYCHLDRPRLSRPLRAWQPHRGADGTLILFDGWIDDRAELAAQLGLAGAGDAELYAAAVARWADAADARIVGHYAAVLAQPDGSLRLSRSPWSAPPLHYANGAAQAVVASVPRVLLAAGIAAELDPEKFADNLFLNLHDEERGWYRGTARVPQGAIVRLTPGQRTLDRWYDPLALPAVRLANDAAYVDAADALLQRATRNALAGAASPAMALSGGLDSALVAAEVLRQLPAGARLPSFTFRPDAAWDDPLPPDLMGDEGPLVEAFAAMHPALDARFTRNDGIAFDHRLDELFLAIGAAPTHLVNYYVYHGVWQGAREAGSDWLLDATLGNASISNDGRWSYVEFARRGRWRQLHRVLARRRGDPRPLWRKLASLSLLPLLPSRVGRAVRRYRHPGREALNWLASAISPSFACEAGVEARALSLGAVREMTQPRSRAEAIRLEYLLADYESSDIHQGFEQLYGLRRRDVTAYRPLIEFCLGLPTDQLVRDGEERWLAKRLARGRLPEAQRLNPRYGRHDADWRVRLGRRRESLREEVERIAGDPDLAPMFDAARMRRLLDDWPEHTPAAREAWMPREVALPRAILAARFHRFVSGRNAV